MTSLLLLHANALGHLESKSAVSRIKCARDKNKHDKHKQGKALRREVYLRNKVQVSHCFAKQFS